MNSICARLFLFLPASCVLCTQFSPQISGRSKKRGEKMVPLNSLASGGKKLHWAPTNRKNAYPFLNRTHVKIEKDVNHRSNSKSQKESSSQPQLSLGLARAMNERTEVLQSKLRRRLPWRYSNSQHTRLMYVVTSQPRRPRSLFLKTKTTSASSHSLMSIATKEHHLLTIDVHILCYG